MARTIGGDRPEKRNNPFKNLVRRNTATPGFRYPLPHDARTGANVPLNPPDPRSDRVGVFCVIEVHDDYLICEGLDPNAGSTVAEKYLHRVAIAKPWLLQKTPFDGKRIEFEDRFETYAYTGHDVRTVTVEMKEEEPETEPDPYQATEEPETTEREEQLSMQYYACAHCTDFEHNHNEPRETTSEPTVLDIITAMRVMTITSDGNYLLDNTGMTYYDEGQERPIEWIDLNSGGRHWTTPSVESGLFPLTFYQTGGEDVCPAEWTYTVSHAITGEELGTDVDPTEAPHEWRRGPLYPIDPATAGVAYFNESGELVILWTNEVLSELEVLSSMEDVEYVMVRTVDGCTALIPAELICEKCSTCYLLISCEYPGSGDIKTLSDMSAIAVGTVIRRAEDQKCYTLGDPVSCSDDAVEVTVEDEFEGCEECENAA
jgi:hypothetical protein